MSEIGIEILRGQILDKVKIGDSNDEIIFVTRNGDEYIMTHYQDCCESVYVDDIVGNLDDLIGEPIVMALEETNCEDTFNKEYLNESFTWTFYKLATIKGYVTIKWLGTSNGYYSERVDFSKIN